MTNQILELERIKQRLEAIALMNPRVSISLRNDENGNKILQTNKCSSTLGIFKQLYGAVKAANLTEVNCSKDEFRVSGYISSEGHFNKNLQFVYINSRLVLKTEIHKFLNKTLKKFYSRKKAANATTQVTSGMSSSPTKQTDKHGVFIVNISCPFNEYDITFDPAKTLVEFKDWETVLLTVNGIVEEFQKQFDVSVSPVGTTLDPKAIASCTQLEVDKKKSSLETDPQKKMSTVDTKSIKTDGTGTILSSPLESLTEKAKDGIDLEITDNSKDNFQAFPEVCVSPAISTISSDTTSTLTCSSGSVKISSDEEDPCVTSRKRGVIPPVSKSPDRGGEGNDSGIDPGITVDTTTNASGCPQSVRLRNPTVNTLKSVFKHPKATNLSSLREKQSKLMVTCKLKELRDSLYRSSGGKQKCNSNQACPKSSTLSSLKRLRKTVEQLQSKGNTDQVSSCETSTGMCMSHSNVSVKEASTHNRATTNTLAGKKRLGMGKETSASKLARLAGIGSQELDSSLEKQCGESKVSVASECSCNLCNISLDGGSAGNPDSDSTCKQDCQSAVSVNPICEPVVQSGTGFIGEGIPNCMFPAISRNKCDTAKVNRFMTTESWITTMPSLPKNGSSRSKVSYNQGKSEPKNEKEFSLNQHHSMGPASTYQRVNSSKSDHLDCNKSISMSETVTVRHCEAEKEVTPEKHNMVKESVSHGEKIQREFCSQDGKIRFSQDSYAAVDAKDVFKSYVWDSEQSVMPSVSSISGHDTVCEQGQNPDKNLVQSSEEDADAKVSQGFDFRTMGPMVNIPGNIQEDDSSFFGTLEKGCTQGNNVKTISSLDTGTSVGERGSDLMSPDRDLIDLFITPSPAQQTPVSQVNSCLDQSELFGCSTGEPNQWSSEFGNCSNHPSSDTNLCSENRNSSPTLSPVDDKLNGHCSEVAADCGLAETCKQTGVPEDMARVTAEADEMKSSEVNLKLESSSAHCIRETSVLKQDKTIDNCDDQHREEALNVQPEKQEGHPEHKRETSLSDQSETGLPLSNRIEDSEGCGSKTDDFLIRNHPMSGEFSYFICV